MTVEIAKTAGFCFGVKRAVDTVYAEIEKAVPRKSVQHVVEETDPRGDIGFSAPVQVKRHADVRLSCRPYNFCRS